jgi:3-hydroxybutyrate dehydrogenase
MLREKNSTVQTLSVLEPACSNRYIIAAHHESHYQLTDSQPFSNFWHPPGKPPSKDDPAASRYALLDINLTHPIRMTQLAISHFISRKKPGVITHISSMAGQKPFFPTPVYVATKHAISGFVRSLAQLETPPATSSLPSIRVNAVAPGVIRTPLWMENKDKLKMIDENADEWVSPEEVAQVMLDLVEKEENVGGTVLEVGKGRVRRVEAVNDPGPEGSGLTVSNWESEASEIWGRLEEYSGARR